MREMSPHVDFCKSPFTVRENRVREHSAVAVMKAHARTPQLPTHSAFFQHKLSISGGREKRKEIELARGDAREDAISFR